MQRPWLISPSCESGSARKGSLLDIVLHALEAFSTCARSGSSTHVGYKQRAKVLTKAWLYAIWTGIGLTCLTWS